MTVATTTSTVTYLGNSATTIFSFPFIGVAAADLVVTVINNLGVSTTLGPTQYSVLINSVPVGGLWGIGGSVTYPLGASPVPIPVGYSLAITRALPYTQTVSISNQGSFYPQTVEQALDKLELQIQQLVTDYTYTLKFPVSDPTPPNTLPSYILRANGTLQFDTNGQPIVAFPSTGGGGAITSATPRKIATTGTATINVLTSDAFGGVSIYQSSSPATTVQLPSTGGPYPIYDASGNAASFPIIVLPGGGKTIAGQTQYVLAFNYQSATFANDVTSVLVS